MSTVTVDVPFEVKKKKNLTIDEIFTLYGRYLQQQKEEFQNYEMDFGPNGIDANKLLSRMKELDND